MLTITTSSVSYPVDPIVQTIETHSSSPTISDNPNSISSDTTPDTNAASIPQSVDTGDFFDERTQQQQRCILATLADLRRNLVLAQQAFETQLQSLLAHCNAMQPSQPLHPPTDSPKYCNPLLTAIRSIPEQAMTDQSVDFLAATWRYPSPLNTQFLLPTGNYNNAATGVHWFKSSLFFLLPFLQRTKVTPTSELCTVPSDHFGHLQTATNITGPTSRPRPYVPVTTDQVRPKFLPNAYSNSSYSSSLPPHDLPYQIKRMNRTLSTSHTDGEPTYRPPWPPPHDSNSRPAINHSVDFKPGQFWPTDHNQSGHRRGLTRPPTVHGRLTPQAYYCFDHRPPQLPPQYCIRLLHCVYLPTSLTEDKNLLRPP